MILQTSPITNRLTDAQVREIRARYNALPRYPTGHAECGTVKEIAYEMKVPMHVINAIVSGRTYRSDTRKRRYEAMEIILQLLASGKARFERSPHVDLLEFCFDGIRYVANDRDWVGILDVVGRDKARKVAV